MPKFAKHIFSLITIGVLYLILANSVALGLTKVVFTVDVESNPILSLPRQVDAICEDGSACGLMEIARMLKERGLAGTFFLNVYEYPLWGETAMRTIATKLQASGQDVALHTHPETAYDPLRTEMYQYSLDEQTAIIQKGVQLLKTWTGQPVVAHRAGDYSADEHTLDALVRNGLKVDSSRFLGHPHSRLTALGLPRNLPASRGRLIEVPVTVYQREERSRPFGDILPLLTSVRKIDANWLIDEDEAKAAIDGIVEAKIPYLVIFLHSFSFLAGKGDGRAPMADRHAREILQAILNRVAEKHLPVVTMRGLAESETVISASQNQDVLPKVTVVVGLHRYVWHQLRSSGVGAPALGAALLFLAGSVVLLTVLRRKAVKRTRDVLRTGEEQARRSGGSRL